MFFLKTKINVLCTGHLIKNGNLFLHQVPNFQCLYFLEVGGSEFLHYICILLYIYYILQNICMKEKSKQICSLLESCWNILLTTISICQEEVERVYQKGTFLMRSWYQ